MDCIKHATSVINELRASTLNAFQKAIRPECVKSENSIIQKSTDCSEIITRVHAIVGEGFDRMQTTDIDELMTDEPLDDERLIELLVDDGRVMRITITITKTRVKQMN